MADDVLRQGIQGISELITIPGLINLDFADVRTIMSEGGAALMAVGQASGEDRARIAAEQAISSQLLDVTINGARGILFNVTGGPDLSLFEVNQAAAIIKETASSDVNLIFGAVVDENMGDNIRITVIATGFDRATPSLEADRSFFRQTSTPKPVDLSVYSSQSAQKLDQTQSVKTPREQYVFTSDVDVDMPAFLRRNRNNH